MRTTTACLLALLVLGLTVSPADAQGTVQGVVRDSTRSTGLAGAEVFVLGSSLRAETDSAGAFVVRNVPFGQRVIVVLHPRLDSLGLDGLEATIELSATTPTVSLELSTPSARALFERACGRAPTGDEALLTGYAGTLDGRPIAGAEVLIDWIEVRVRPGEMTRSPHAITATTDGAGAYNGCGVPGSLEPQLGADGWTTIVHQLRVRAGQGGRSTGALIMFPNSQPMQRLDLVLGDDDGAARSSVRGRIVTETGEPIERGRVISSSDSSLTADVDVGGAFMLDGLRRRTEQLYVRAVGHVPAWIEFVATDSILDLGDVVLSPIPQRLATMLVTAELHTRELREFEERRAVGLGTYLDEEDIAKFPLLTPAVLRMYVPRAQLVNGLPGEPQLFVFRRGIGVCYPIWYVDGYLVRGMSSPEMYSRLGFATRVEVYTAAFAPPRFVDFNGCGSVVVWTR